MPLPKEQVAEGDNAIDTMGSMNSQACILDLTQLSDTTQKRLSTLTGSKTGKVSVRDLKNTSETMVKQQSSNRWLRGMVLVLLLILFVQAWATFGMSFWAVNLAKDSQVVESAAGGSPSFTSNDKNSIMRTAPAKDTLVSLKHAVVLDMEHLRTIEEITYTVKYGLQKVHHTNESLVVSDRVVSIMKTVTGEPTVTIMTHGGNRLVLLPGKATMTINGETMPLCGALSCSSFKVSDPELDVGELDAKLVTLIGADAARRLSFSRKLGFWGDVGDFFTDAAVGVATAASWCWENIAKPVVSVLSDVLVWAFGDGADLTQIICTIDKVMSLPDVYTYAVKDAMTWTNKDEIKCKQSSNSQMPKGGNNGHESCIAALAATSAYHRSAVHGNNGAYGRRRWAGRGGAVGEVMMGGFGDPRASLKAHGWAAVQEYVWMKTTLARDYNGAGGQDGLGNWNIHMAENFLNQGDRSQLWKKGSECIIAFSGSDDHEDFENDLWTTTKQNCFAPNDYIGEGLCAEWKLLWQAMKDQGFITHLKGCDKNKLMVTGHSLGGGLTGVFSYYANKLNEDPLGLKGAWGDFKGVYKSYEFGPIPTGDYPLKNHANDGGCSDTASSCGSYAILCNYKQYHYLMTGCQQTCGWCRRLEATGEAGGAEERRLTAKGNCFPGARFQSASTDEDHCWPSDLGSNFRKSSCVDFAVWVGHKGGGAWADGCEKGAGNLYHPLMQSITIDTDGSKAGGRRRTAGKQYVDDCDGTNPLPAHAKIARIGTHSKGALKLHMPMHYTDWTSNPANDV